jgi:hypothetical protein
MIYKQFYSELGKLLYAVADVDGKISQEEKRTLHELVNEELSPVANKKDAFGTNLAFYTEFEFDVMEENGMDPESAFQSFIDFVEDHKKVIDHRMISAIRKVTFKLANAYHSTNEKERELLSVLNKKLDAIEKQKK